MVLRISHVLGLSLLHVPYTKLLVKFLQLTASVGTHGLQASKRVAI